MPSHPLKISASILSADFSCLADQIHQAESGGANWIHIDVMDGQFVPNLTMGPFIVEACKGITFLPLDAHLMINNPERQIPFFAQAGVEWLTVHIENSPNIHRTLQQIRSLGCRPGIAINPGTPPCAISSVLNSVDLILVMSVNPGYSGQEFIPESVEKIREIKKMVASSGSQALVQVDGGISADTLPLVIEAGADCIVAATAIFKHPAGIQSGIHALREAVNQKNHGLSRDSLGEGKN